MRQRPGTEGSDSQPQPGGVLTLLRDVIILLAAGGLTWAEKEDGRN